MSDFYLDLREQHLRNTSVAASLQYFPDMRLHRFDLPDFHLAITRADSAALWSPFQTEEKDTLVALGGRVALDEQEWVRARSTPGEGGLACKAIYRAYREKGAKALEQLNGNYLVLLYDARLHRLFLVTDRCGMYPCFRHASELVYASHPDTLARATGDGNRWDMVSLAEFLMCGRVSFPYTYYEQINAVSYGRRIEFDLGSHPAAVTTEKSYFSFAFKPDTSASAPQLASELGTAFRKAVERRTLPSLGRAAFALSGGLDSRTVVSLARNTGENIAFCCVDSENREHATAREIAKHSRVHFYTLKRSPDFYAENAEMGVRISGGMGSIANNHFLGFRDWCREMQVENLLTGCYCDYLFKGLVLDKKTSRLTGRQSLGPFRDQHYFLYFPLRSSYAPQVIERHGTLFPESLRLDISETGRLEIERRRTFPLFYEGDNMQRVVPQRVMPWYLPIVDSDLIDVYLRIPAAMKLNRHVFSLMVREQCPPEISRIPDANTEARVGAGSVQIAARRILRRLTARQTAAPAGSWPDWKAYVPASEVLRDLWHRSSQGTREVLKELTGHGVFRDEIRDYRDNDTFFFVRLLTLKIWLDQRQV